MTQRWIGRARPRVEDDRLTAGEGRYAGDRAPEGCLHLAFVRSPYAHARIVAVDTAAARTAPGVAAVYTGDDVQGLGALPVNPLLPDLRAPPWPVLAKGRVQAVGQPVAAVVAETPAAAADAAELVEPELVPLAPLVDPADALAGPPIMDGRDDNVPFDHRWRAGEADAAFAAAHRIVAVRVDHPRLAPMSLEPRACLAEPEPDGRLTVWLPTQAPQRARADLAAILGIDAARLRVAAPDVGGAFGMKASLYPEDALTAWAALRLGRPVRWVASRGEDMLAATHGRGLVTEAEAAVDAAGTITAVRADIVAPLGHWMPFSGVVPARNAARILPGPYAVDAVDIRARGVLTTAAPVGIYRGAGRPEAAALMERLADAAAEALGMDPAELRRRNAIPAGRMPYATPTGETYDSGDFAAVLDRACAAAGYDALRRDQAERRAAGELVGVGLGLYVEPCGTGWEYGAVRLEADGTVTAATGSSAQGQGRETTFQAIVADALGVATGQVRVVHGDTDAVPAGIGALASRSTAIGGSAIHEAATAVRAEAVRRAAALLQADPAAVEPGPDGLRAGAGGTLSWRALAEAAGDEAIAAEVRYESQGEAWACGCCIAVLCVDRETGAPTVERIVWADDTGVVVNPLLADGQLVGGLAQGLGQALMERIVYDEQGQLVTGSLMDYAVPRAADMPPVLLDRLETPARTNPLGAKGLGEAGCIGVPAAILNAAHDALAPLGVNAVQMPLTAARLWAAMRDAGGRESR